MHKYLIKAATEDQLRSFTEDALGMIKETNHELYDTLEMYLYKELYGCHFCDWMLEKATSKMVNEDGTSGAHWNVADTTAVARNNGITFDSFNEYDWNYVMNMMYSDYYGAVNNSVDSYMKLAKKFLMDKDAKEGKALHYYFAMK